MANSRNVQKECTHARLVAVALKVFAANGIAATRTLDLARAAKVAHGTVFAHFPTRETMVIAAIETFADQVMKRLHELVEEGAGIREVLAAHLRSLSEHEVFYARLVTEGPLLPEMARINLLGIQSAISYHLFAAAERERAARKIRPVPQHLLFNTWLGLIHHYVCNRELFAPGRSVLAIKGEELLNHFMGLLAP